MIPKLTFLLILSFTLSFASAQMKPSQKAKVSTQTLAKHTNTTHTRSKKGSSPLAIIDMHLHASKANSQGSPPIIFCLPVTDLPLRDPQQPYPQQFLNQLKSNSNCKIRIASPTTDEEVFSRTLSMMKKYNIYGIASGSEIRTWAKAEPNRILPGLAFNMVREKYTPDSLHKLLSTGYYKIFGEISNQYYGVLPADTAFDKYLAVAEELDIPVGIHVGPGPYGSHYLGFKNYRANHSSPLLLEEMLIRHPRLRLFIMHAGWPMGDDLIALLYAHPQVYADVAVINWVLPKKEFHRYLQRLMDAGLGKRILFGSDQMIWPEAMEVAIQSIESSTFLTTQQKRDIFYNNAARFLRLSEAEIAKHHGRNLKQE